LTTVAIVGLGYVGLPLAIAFGRQFRTIGYDFADAKIESYRAGVDPNRQLSGDELRTATRLEYTADPKQLVEADRIIVAVPTPVDSAHQPDFGPLRGASQAVGRHMRRGAVIVFESTVYPGATEEICVLILEQCSGLQ
jgi:UDP-N-acetyl-D-galactosamine dehydrogenase